MKKRFFTKISSTHWDSGSLDSCKMWHPFLLTSVTTCLLFTWCFRSTKPQDPVLSILSHYMWQLSLFHLMITTLKFTWHFSSLPASLNSYTNDVNTHRTIVNHELISTKCTGACFHRVIPKTDLHALKKCIESQFLMELRIYCSVHVEGARCC